MQNTDRGKQKDTVTPSSQHNTYQKRKPTLRWLICRLITKQATNIPISWGAAEKRDELPSTVSHVISSMWKLWFSSDSKRIHLMTMHQSALDTDPKLTIVNLGLFLTQFDPHNSANRFRDHCGIEVALPSLPSANYDEVWRVWIGRQHPQSRTAFYHARVGHNLDLHLAYLQYIDWPFVNYFTSRARMSRPRLLDLLANRCSSAFTGALLPDGGSSANDRRRSRTAFQHLLYLNVRCTWGYEVLRALWFVYVQ